MPPSCVTEPKEITTILKFDWFTSLEGPFEDHGPALGSECFCFIFVLFLSAFLSSSRCFLSSLPPSVLQGNQSVPGGAVHRPRLLSGQGDPPAPGPHVQGQHRLWVKPKGTACLNLKQSKINRHDLALWLNLILAAMEVFLIREMISSGKHLELGLI